MNLIRLFVEQGLCSKEVAWQLHLSPKTVETHRANIFRKLHRILPTFDCQHITVLDLAFFAITNEMVDLAKIREKYTLAIPGPS